eukprot:972947-Pleurochrysis_carterae.AAC.1
MRGNSQRGAWSSNRGHHAAPPLSPQLAGFLTIHAAPAACAASTRSAVNVARALCLVTLRRNREDALRLRPAPQLR